MTLHPSSRMASRSWVANKTARSPRRSFRSAAAFFHGLRVHAGEGFVQQQGITPGPESAEQGRTALLPAGKIPGRQGKRLLIISKSLKIRHDLRFVLCFSLREHQFHVLHGGQLRAEPVLLKRQRRPRPTPCTVPESGASSPIRMRAGWSCPSRWVPRERQAPQGSDPDPQRAVFSPKRFVNPPNFQFVNHFLPHPLPTRGPLPCPAGPGTASQSLRSAG